MSAAEKQAILTAQNCRCNICGAILRDNIDIPPHTFAKDRVRVEFDHRIPVDRGVINDASNIQALCHYCNKCKRQMCFVCPHSECSSSCALVYPEYEEVVLATGENIIDRITNR